MEAGKLGFEFGNLLSHLSRLQSRRNIRKGKKSLNNDILDVSLLPPLSLNQTALNPSLT
jgi:hypothetical protein